MRQIILYAINLSILQIRKLRLKGGREYALPPAL